MIRASSGRRDLGEHAVAFLGVGLQDFRAVYLAVALVALIVGWIVITAIGKVVPDQIPVVTVTIGGGLVGVIN